MSELIARRQDLPLRRPALRGTSETLDLSAAMQSADEFAFTYDPAEDRFRFDTPAMVLLGVLTISDVETGVGFQMRVGAEFREARRRIITPPPTGMQHSYCVQYRFEPGGKPPADSIYLEEQGSWHARANGEGLIARGVMRVITQRFLDETKLRYRGEHDGLTGQLNRTALLERLDVGIDRSRQTRKPMAFLLASVNGLDVINDTFGLETGDDILVGVARVLRRHLREADAVGRYASNKFGIILNDCGPGTMRVVADRLMTAVRSATINTSSSKISASLSIGGVSLPDYATAPQGAVMAALKALERARGRRVDGFVAFEPRPEEDNVKRLNATLASALINALDENRMSLLLQPLVTASTGLPDHYECLLRMVRSDGTLISAGEFMPIAEQLGIARLLDLRAQELAVDLLKRYPSAKLSLNVSGLTASDNEWIVSLHRLTQGKRQYLQRLTVEITETAAIHDLDQSMIFVDTIKDLGCKVAIDDFGVGYTNFRNLKALNADLVKIDGAFVRNVCHDRGDQVFVRSMVELAKAFGMQTVAEWVGDAETASFLTGAGIDFLQGYHFGEPAPPETVLGAPTPA